MEYERFTDEILLAWFYYYEGMTTLEQAILGRINEIRAEHNLEPLIHDPTLSVGARFRTAYFSRFDVFPSHTGGALRTGSVSLVFSPLLTGGAILVGGFDNVNFDSAGVAYRIVNAWLASTTGHREAVLTQTHTHIGVGIDRAVYAFIGSH